MKKQAATPNREDEHAADGRPDHPGRVHQHAVEAHRVGQQVEPDHLGDEGLAGRVVEQVDEPEPRRQHVDLPQVGRVRHDQHAQDEGQDARRGLRGVEHLALVDPVGDQAAEGAEQQQRQELQAGGDGDVDPGAVEREEDQVGLRHRLHPGARHRDDLPGEVEPVVADRDGAEGAAAGRRGRRALHGSTKRCSSNPTSSAACCCSSALSSSEAAQEKGVLAGAHPLERRARRPA